MEKNFTGTVPAAFARSRPCSLAPALALAPTVASGASIHPRNAAAQSLPAASCKPARPPAAVRSAARVSLALAPPAQHSHRWFRFSRNIGPVTLKIIYFYDLKKYIISGSKYPRNSHFSFENSSNDWYRTDSDQSDGSVASSVFFLVPKTLIRPPRILFIFII